MGSDTSHACVRGQLRRRRRIRSTFVAALLAFCSVPVSHASSGDYSPTYKRCVSHCTAHRCPPSSSFSAPPSNPPIPDFPSDPIQFSLPLRLFAWSCPDECSYQCMHHLTSLSLLRPQASLPPGKAEFDGWWEEADWTGGSALEGLPPGRVVQYHGKWPFRRFLGLQEPLSVLFSLLNLSGYLRSWRPLERETRRYPPLRGLYLGVLVLGANMWVWSSIFHARDKRWTERADYFSAAAYNLWGFYVACVRVLHLYPSHAAEERTFLSRRARATLRRSLLGVVIIAFGMHVMYLLSDTRFDYRYNMIANIVVSLLTLTLWCGWSLSWHLPALSRIHRRKAPTANPSSWAALALSNPPHTLRPWLLSIWLIAASALELLDFPPVFGRSLDAHALWHLATVPLARLWCVRFLAQDAKWEANRERDLERVRRA